MKAGKTWSLRDVDEQTRTALLKAAEKSGLSVNDWLGTDRNGDAATPGASAGSATPPGSMARSSAMETLASGKDEFPAGDDDPSVEVREAIGRLTGRLGVMDEAARGAVNGLPARLSEIENRLAFLVEAKQNPDERRRSLTDASMMIDALVRDIDGAAIRSSTFGGKPAPIPAAAAAPAAAITRPAPVSEPMPAPRLVAPIPSNPTVAMPKPQPSPAAEQLADIRFQLDALLAHDDAPRAHERPAGPAPTAPAKAPMAEARPSESVVPKPAPQPTSAPSASASPASALPAPAPTDPQHLHRLEAKIGEIMARLPAKKDADLAAAIRDISTRQKSIDERADTAAMRRDQQSLNSAVAALHGEVSSLNARVATMGGTRGVDDTAILGLTQRLEALTADRPVDRNLLQAIRSDLDHLKAKVSDTSLHGAIKDLEGRHTAIAERVDTLLAKAPDGRRLETMGDEISALRHLLESDGRDGANERIETRLADLAARIDTIAAAPPVAAPPVAVDLTKIEQRFDSLAKTVSMALSRSTTAPTSNDDIREFSGRLDAISASLGRLVEKVNTAPSATASPTVAALESRLSQMASDINGLLDREATGERAPVMEKIEAKLETLAESVDGLFMGMPPQETNAILQHIDARFDTMTIGGSAAGLSRVEERLDRIASDLEHFGAPKGSGGDSEGLHARMDQIADMLTGLAKRVPSTVEVETLHARLAGLADRIERANATMPENTLQADLDDIRTEVSSIRAVHQRLQTLTERIDSIAAVQHQPLLAIAEIKDGIGAIRAMHERIQTITDRIDRMSAQQRDPVQGEQLKAGIAAMRAVQDRVQMLSERFDASSQSQESIQEIRSSIAAIGGIHEEMRSLAEKISGMAVQRAPVAVLEDIKKDIVAIRIEIAERRPTSNQPLERLVADLAKQVSTVSRAPSDPAGIQDLAHRVTALAGELEEAKPKVQRLEEIEQRMARLQDSLGDNRKESIEAAKAEARAVVQDLSRMVATGEVDANVVGALLQDLESLKTSTGDSDRRVRSKLDAVNTTLAQVVARLSQLEGEATRRAQAETEAPQGWTPAPRPAAVGEEAPTTLPLVRQQVEDSNVEKDGRERRADFIAAARRAAQAAAADAAKPQTPGSEPEKTEKQGALARFSQAILNRKRTLLLAAAAIVLAVGALQIFASRLANNNPHGPPLIAANPAADQPIVTAAAANIAVIPLAKAPAQLALPPASDVRIADAPPLLVAPVGIDKAIAFADPVYPTTVTTDAAQSTALALAPAAPPAVAAPATTAPASVVILASANATDPTTTASVNPLLDRTIGSSKLTSAALSGDAAAEYEVGARYAAGDRIPRNMAKAAEWYQRAADAGLAVAEFRLASLYERGDGVKQDLKVALGWYQKAADQGNVNAMHNLAVLLSQDTTATATVKVALKWFQAAANYGLRDSQYNLGVIYARGLGTTPNLPESYKWFAIAAAGGDADAGARRDELAKSMSPGELAQAQTAVAGWKLKTPNPQVNTPPVPAGGWDSDIVAQSDQLALVKTIQTLLTGQGYDPGPADGRIGPKTRQAVKDYQHRSGVPETGALDNTLLASLSANGR